MSVLEDYEKRMGLSPLSPDQVLGVVQLAENHMATCTHNGVRTTSADDDRVLIWLHDHAQALTAIFDSLKGVPLRHRCGWCFRAGPMTREAWEALPSMDLDAVQAHAGICEHNPLVQKIVKLRAQVAELLRCPLDVTVQELQAQVADLQGRSGGVDVSNLREKIRSLLKSGKPACELRRALGDLVR